MKAYFRRRHPPLVAALLFLIALCVAPVLARAEPIPSPLTSMSEAAIDGAAPADDPARIERWNALREAIFG
jgi:hypothetical protein